MIRLFLILLTVTVACLGWITGQIRSYSYILLVLGLVAVTTITFLALNIYERKQEENKRKEREARKKEPSVQSDKVLRSKGSFALREKKSGLTWGGGNIKASEATRGTKRKFLGR